MLTAADHLLESGAHSRLAHDLLEQAPDSATGQALAEALDAIAHLRQAVRTQQTQIDNLLAAVPQADRQKA